jgi:putative oligomerization/nucleic acid binding protein
MGLLRAAARTAVVAGTAKHVHGRVAARQQSRWAQQTAAPAPAASPAPAPSERDTGTMIAHLKELGQLRDAGVLTEAEFEVQKARVLHR